MTISVVIPKKTYQGLVPIDYARNNLPPHAPWVRNGLAENLNHLLAQRGPIVPPKAVAPELARNSASNLRLWTTRYRASANGTTLVSVVRCIPTDDSTQPNPRWYLQVDGVAQADQSHSVYCESGGGKTFTDAFEMVQEVAVTAGTKHTIDLYTDDKCRVISWSLYEKPSYSFFSGVHTYADPSPLPLSPIFDATMASIRAALDHVWQKMRGITFSWNVDDPASPVAVSSTLATYLWDSGGATGVVTPTQYRNTYANENLLRGIANKSIPCYAWVLAERTAGAGNVILRLLGGNHAGAGAIDIACNGALGIYESTSFTLLPASGGDTVKAQYLVSAGGTTGNIYAAGVFPLVGT